MARMNTILPSGDKQKPTLRTVIKHAIQTVLVRRRIKTTTLEHRKSQVKQQNGSLLGGALLRSSPSIGFISQKGRSIGLFPKRGAQKKYMKTPPRHLQKVPKKALQATNSNKKPREIQVCLSLSLPASQACNVRLNIMVLLLAFGLS